MRRLDSFALQYPTAIVKMAVVKETEFQNLDGAMN